MNLVLDLVENSPDLVSAMLRRFATTDLEWFFDDFALNSEDYPDEIHDIILSLCDILNEQPQWDMEKAERELASVGIAILALYDLTRPERATNLTIEQDMIARALIEQVVENQPLVG